MEKLLPLSLRLQSQNIRIPNHFVYFFWVSQGFLNGIAQEYEKFGRKRLFNSSRSNGNNNFIIRLFPAGSAWCEICRLFSGNRHLQV